MSQAIKAYYLALDRLKRNKPINLPKGTAINKDTVAMEAGKKRGSLRDRKGFESLLEDIQKASEGKPKRTINNESSVKYENAKSQINLLQEENNKLKTRYMSLLYLNLELAKLLRKEGFDVPKFGHVVDLKIE